jgi:hypothetical protein
MGDTGLTAAGVTLVAIIGYLAKVAIGTIVAVAVARAMGVPI